MVLSHGEANVNLQSHYPPWKLSTWHLQKPPRSCCGCGGFSPSWATETINPRTCSPIIKVCSHYPRIQFHMPERSILTCVTTLFVMQFRIMLFGYSISPRRI